MFDRQYTSLPGRLNELEHHYGPNVHLLSDPYLMTLLASLCHPDTYQPRITQLLSIVYRMMVGMVSSHEFPRKITSSPTRMGQRHPEGVYEGEIIDPDNKVVVVDIARAGMVPSQVVFEHLCTLLNPRHVRQDHLFMNRRANEAGEVVGIDFSGSKIGGDIDDAWVLLPDPMGATGRSLGQALDVYREVLGDKRAHFIAMHLIVTPEYLKYLHTHHPDVTVYAVRLDRGLSDPAVLQTVPGTLWDQERGLNDHHYIVPGGGGFGEIINNAFV